MTWRTEVLAELHSSGATFDEVVVEAMRTGVSAAELLAWWHEHAADGALVRCDAAGGPVRYRLAA